MDNAELIPTVNFLTNTTTPNIKWEYQIKDLIGGNKSIGVGKDAVLDTQTGKITLSKNPQTDDAVNEYNDYIRNQVLGTSLTLADNVENGTELNFDDFSLYVSVVKE